MRQLTILSLLAFLLVGLSSDGVNGQAKVDPKDKDKKVDPKDKKVDPYEEEYKKWPTELGGKKLEDWVKDCDTAFNKDPSLRDAALRMLPNFGPRAHRAASATLLKALTTDPDYNVRLTAMEIVPLIGLDDKEIDQGLNYIFSLLREPSIFTKSEAIACLTKIGGFEPVRKRITEINQIALNQTGVTSWQLRRNAVGAIGIIGGPLPKDKEGKTFTDPMPEAVKTLCTVLRNDNSIIVRRQAAVSLTSMGVVGASEQLTWRQTLLDVIRIETNKKDKDKKDIGDRPLELTCRICLILNSPDKKKDESVHLTAIAAYLKHPEPAARVDALEALGTLGPVAEPYLGEIYNLYNDKEIPVVLTAIRTSTVFKDKHSRTLEKLKELVEARKEYLKKNPPKEKPKDPKEEPFDPIKVTAEEAIKFIEEGQKQPKDKKEMPKQ
ncbi:MAG: hypothetical protein N2112_16585 [Gemmataceae bacterium]|nr:hypothetical protein [Gemmataceae bacterium]